MNQFEAQHPQEVLDAQERVKPLYAMLEARAAHRPSPLRMLIDDCIQRARPDNTSEIHTNKV